MAKASFLLTIVSLLITSVAIAQDPPPRISDEGGAKSVYFNLDCVGGGVSCSTSGINATITVPAAATPTIIVQESDSNVDTAVTTLDFGSCFDGISSPAGEANISFDSSECTVNADALKANGANCAANSYPLGVDASGAVESCGTNISGNAGTATALAANGANCSAGNYPLGVDASGAVESCTVDDDVPESGDLAAATLQVVTNAGKTTSNQLDLDRTSANADSPEASIDIYVNRTEGTLTGLAGILSTVEMTGSTAQSGFAQAGDFAISNSNTTAGTPSLQGVRARATNNSGAGNITSIRGLDAAATNNSTGTVSTAYGGIYTVSGAASSGLITNAYDVFTSGLSSNASATNAHNLYINPPNTFGTITTWYGIYVNQGTAATNNYELFMEDGAEIYFGGPDAYITGSSLGTITMHATSDIDSDQNISFPDNKGTRYGTGDDASIVYDGTNMIIEPDLVGSGRLQIGAAGANDVEMDELGLCGTSLTGATSIVTGSCSGAKRGVLNFIYTRTAGTGLGANVSSTITAANSAVSATLTSVNASAVQGANSAGTNTIRAYNAAYSGTVNLTGGTHKFTGVDISPGNGPASSAGATIFQVGLNVGVMSAFASATAETQVGIVNAEDLLQVSGTKLYLEGTGTAAPVPGDSYVWYDNSDNDIEVFAENLQVADFDDDVTQLGDVVAGNYFQFYNAASGVIPEGSFKPVGTAIIAIDGDKPVFCYSGDVDACFYFSTTNAYEFRDLGGTSRFNLDVLNGDVEVGTANRGVDMVTAAADMDIGRVNAGDIAYGNTTNTPSHTFKTTDGSSVVIDATTPMQVLQPTVGDKVQQLTSTATNDDPQESMRQYRTTTTDATVTTLATIATSTDTAQIIDCVIDARRTGGASGAAGDIATYKLYCSNKNVSGTVTEIAETEDFTAESQAAFDVDCSVSGTNYLVRVTGAASNNVTWHGTCRIYSIGS